MERDPRKLREYGLGASDHKVVGPPEVLGPVTAGMGAPTTACPNCHCRTLFLIRVNVIEPRLRGTMGLGTYVGCPACPWASPMVMMSTVHTTPPPNPDDTTRGG